MIGRLWVDYYYLYILEYMKWTPEKLTLFKNQHNRCLLKLSIWCNNTLLCNFWRPMAYAHVNSLLSASRLIVAFGGFPVHRLLFKCHYHAVIFSSLRFLLVFSVCILPTVCKKNRANWMYPFIPSSHDASLQKNINKQTWKGSKWCQSHRIMKDFKMHHSSFCHPSCDSQFLHFCWITELHRGPFYFLIADEFIKNK